MQQGCQLQGLNQALPLSIATVLPSCGEPSAVSSAPATAAPTASASSLWAPWTWLGFLRCVVPLVSPGSAPAQHCVDTATAPHGAQRQTREGLCASPRFSRGCPALEAHGCPHCPCLQLASPHLASPDLKRQLHFRGGQEVRQSSTRVAVAGHCRQGVCGFPWVLWLWPLQATLLYTSQSSHLGQRP
jgi:hypothetical protein